MAKLVELFETGMEPTFKVGAALVDKENRVWYVTSVTEHTSQFGMSNPPPPVDWGKKYWRVEVEARVHLDLFLEDMTPREERTGLVLPRSYKVESQTFEIQVDR